MSEPELPPRLPPLNEEEKPAIPTTPRRETVGVIGALVFGPASIVYGYRLWDLLTRQEGPGVHLIAGDIEGRLLVTLGFTLVFVWMWVGERGGSR